MSSFRFKKQIFLAAPLLMAFSLSGCDGYERVAYTGFPYNNERTAGTGVAYVRANMLPEKGPVIEAAKPENKEIVKPKAETPPPPPPAAPVKETKDILDDVSDDRADEIFSNAQDK